MGSGSCPKSILFINAGLIRGCLSSSLEYFKILAISAEQVHFRLPFLLEFERWSQGLFQRQENFKWGHFQFLVIVNPTSSVKILRHPNEKTARTSGAKEIYVVQHTLQKYSVDSSLINEQRHVDAFGEISLEPDYKGQIKRL